MSNVKPGDMAKIVAPHKQVGMVVEVLRPIEEGEKRMLLEGSCDYTLNHIVWGCKIFGGGRSLDVKGGGYYYALPGEDCLIWDGYLRRIEPGEPDEAIDEKTDLEVTA
jgi:hypothetical protein